MTTKPVRKKDDDEEDFLGLIPLGSLIANLVQYTSKKALEEQHNALKAHYSIMIERYKQLKRPPFRQRKLHIRTEADPKRIIAWAVAQRVREAREKQGLRQDDLAGISGIARPNIVRLEQGRHLPTLTTLKKIADALGLDINSLMVQPAATRGDKLEFRKIAESGLGEWSEKLEIEDSEA